MNASMGAMADFWDDDHLDVYSKYLIFCAFPCNLLLWDCESWDLRQTLLDALEVFLHRSLRRILQIQVRHVIEHQIKNEHVREMFFNIPTIRNQILRFWTIHCLFVSNGLPTLRGWSHHAVRKRVGM